jgi:proliferating cell nuclear antigen
MTMLLDIQTVQSNALRTLIEVLKDVLNDINITFDETGVKIMAMDGSHVALIHMKLHSDRFEKYYCKQKLNIGVCMSSWFKLMKTVGTNDTVSLFIEEENPNELGICIENADKNSSTTFRLKLLDIDNQDLNIPNVEINCIVTMPSNDFQRLCRDMSNIGDTVEIRSDKEGLHFKCEGDFASQETVIGEATHGLVYNKRADDEEINGKYSLKYINLFTKSTNLCNTIELYLKPNYPIILKYSVANLGEIRFCLAPKME